MENNDKYTKEYDMEKVEKELKHVRDELQGLRSLQINMMDVIFHGSIVTNHELTDLDSEAPRDRFENMLCDTDICKKMIMDMKDDLRTVSQFFKIDEADSGNKGKYFRG